MNAPNKDIFLITRRMGDNFGSSLQAYALQQTLFKHNFDNKIIKYDEYCLRWKLRPFAHDCIYTAFRIFSPITRRVMPQKYNWFKDRNIQQKRYSEFEKQYLTLTTQSFANGDVAALSKSIKKGDTCICGSDQIWSPLLFDPVMFLNFCKGLDCKTISYAPSIGVSEVETHREEMAELINNIDYISVREHRGSQIIKELTNRSATVVADPTLLLPEAHWQSIATPIKNERPYILCYFLGHEEIPTEFVSQLSKKTGLDVYVVYSYRYPLRMSGDKILSTLSPTEFLGYIANASYICTNSFHGSIFSIIFEKEFFCFERKVKSKVTSQNSRIESLLKLTNLEHRLLDINSAIESTPPTIDYSQAKGRLAELRRNSLDYLISSIEKQ